MRLTETTKPVRVVDIPTLGFSVPLWRSKGQILKGPSLINARVTIDYTSCQIVFGVGTAQKKKHKNDMPAASTQQRQSKSEIRTNIMAVCLSPNSGFKQIMTCVQLKFCEKVGGQIGLQLSKDGGH